MPPKSSQTPLRIFFRQAGRVWRWLINKPFVITSSVLSFVFFYFGGINDILDFIKRWPEDWVYIVSITIALIWLFLFILVAFIVFFYPRNLAKRFKSYFSIAFWVLLLVPFLAWNMAATRNRELDKKIIVLVADFVGPENDNYQVTDELVSQLRKVLAEDPNALVLSLHEAIHETDDVGTAGELGKKYHADLVLWGRYSVQEKDVILNVHVENLQSKFSELPASSQYTDLLYGQLQRLEFREKFSSDMNALTLFMSGVVYFSDFQWEKAEQKFSKAIDQESWPDQLIPKSLLYYQRGFINYSMGHFAEALADLNTLKPGDPDYLIAQFNIASIYQWRQEYDAAIKVLDAVIDQKPGLLGIAYSIRGSCYFEKKEYSKAEQDLKQAILLDASFAASYYNLGNVYAEQNRYQEASDQYTLAIANAPDMYVAYDNRGKMNYHLGKPEDAIADYKTSLSFAPNNALAYAGIGTVYQYLYNDPGTAMKYYDQSLAIDPNDARTLSNYGTALVSQNKHVEARNYFDRALSNDPSDEGALIGSIANGVTLGRRDIVIRDCRKLLDVTQNPELKNLAISTLQQLGVTP